MDYLELLKKFAEEPLLDFSAPLARDVTCRPFKIYERKLRQEKE
jgi:hypothetical protein